MHVYTLRTFGCSDGFVKTKRQQVLGWIWIFGSVVHLAKMLAITQVNRKHTHLSFPHVLQKFLKIMMQHQTFAVTGAPICSHCLRQVAQL
jgi:uncharacterized membrane protein